MTDTAGSVLITLRRVQLPLVRPFRTSRGTEIVRDMLLLSWTDEDGITGWAESAADTEPLYFGEFFGSVEAMLPIIFDTMRQWQASRAGSAASHPPWTASAFRAATQGLIANPVAKALPETAILDAELRRAQMSLTDYLGGVHRPVGVGVSVGIPDHIDTLLEWVSGYLDDGYRRIKLKIQPGWDLEPIRAVRDAFGSALSLQADANQAYTTADIPHLLRLDDYHMLLLEQPFARDDVLGHARYAKRARTPVCLDESVLSLGDAATALALQAADVINIKPSRVGGYLTSRQIHDLCLANGIPVFCGGVLESGVGRAANLALATLPGFTLPGDISATSRYYAKDITAPFELADGCLTPPTGPGIGVDVDLAALDGFTTSVRQYRI